MAAHLIAAALLWAGGATMLHLASRRRIPEVPESEVLRACLRALQARGIFAWRNNTGMFFASHEGRRRAIRAGHPGSADILGLLPDGRLLAVEAKRPGKLPGPGQVAFLQAINTSRGVGVWVSSVDQLEAVLDLALAGRRFRVDDECNVFLEDL